LCGLFAFILAAAEDFSSYSYPHTETVLQLNRTIFGNTGFRMHQREVINANLQGRDTFVVMPTGGGKSLCYQLAAIAQPGLTVVFSPLISLMQDQVCLPTLPVLCTDAEVKG
jgi:ATP-dependent DNA helicase RecQ